MVCLQSQSFLFKLVHQLLPNRERLHRLISANSPLCWCDSGEVETYQHCFYTCNKNSEAAECMMRCAKAYATELTEEKTLTLQVKADEVFLLATITILTTGLESIWSNRQLKKVTTPYMIRADLECALSIKRRSRNKSIREAGNIISNVLNNFL